MDPSKAITKAQQRQLVNSTAYTLRHRYGIGQSGPDNDVVLCISSGHWLLPTLFYSTIAAGGVFTSSNPGSTAWELAGNLAQVDAKLMFCNEDTKAVAIAGAKLAGLPLSRLLVLGSRPAFELSEQENGDAVPVSPANSLGWERITDRSALENSIICVLFSSGTTGKPKVCRLSHANMVSEATLVIDVHRDVYRRQGREFVYNTLAHLPTAHIAGVQGYFVNPFYAGGTLFWMARFDFAEFLAHAKRHPITSFFSVPPVFLLIAKSPLVTDQLDAIESAVSGAAPMGRELQAVARAKLGHGRAHLSQTWGLSETTGSMTMRPLDVPDDTTGSVSMLLSNCEARVVDDGGRDVEPGSPGEIWVKGPQVTKGYFKNDAANREAFVDGWFCTGDIGFFKNDMLYIVDRKKELIKYKGNQVAPAELEALLLSHPKILDAAVIGVAGADTEVPRAYVVADPKAISAEDIAAWVGSQVANHKKVRGGVFFLAAIPKSPSGKILRKDLRELARKDAKKSKL